MVVYMETDMRQARNKGLGMTAGRIPKGQLLWGLAVFATVPQTFGKGRSKAAAAVVRTGMMKCDVYQNRDTA